MKAHSAATRHLVLRLLQAGHTQTQVAQQTGLGIATVTRINARRGRLRAVRPHARPHGAAIDPTDPPPGYDPQQVRRCSGCGKQVYLWPCLACQLEGRCEIPQDLKPKRKRRARKLLP